MEREREREERKRDMKAKTNQNSGSGNGGVTDVTAKEARAVKRMETKLSPGEAESKRKAYQLPMASSLFKKTKDMNEAVQLLEEGLELKAQMEQMEPRLKEIKQELIGVCGGCGVEGFRYGSGAVIVNEKQGRKSLNAQKLRQVLVDIGVDPTAVDQAINDSYSQGEPYYEVRLEELS